MERIESLQVIRDHVPDGEKCQTCVRLFFSSSTIVSDRKIRRLDSEERETQKRVSVVGKRAETFPGIDVDVAETRRTKPARYPPRRSN